MLCRRLVAPLLAVMILASCGHKKNPAAPAPAPAGPVSDFALTDVNPNSATFNVAVSPRQLIGQISAWYFGHAT